MSDIIAIWQAAWYELDQPVKLELKDTFSLIEKTGILKFRSMLCVLGNTELLIKSFQ